MISKIITGIVKRRQRDRSQPVANAFLKRAADAGIECMRFRASTMAAGPCALARGLDMKKVPIREASQLPFAGCEHPDQCGCRWQAWIPLMDELGS